MKIAFFGTPRFAQIILEKLVDSPFKPQLAITAPDTKIGRGQKVRPSPVKQTATENNIEVAYLSRRLLKRSDHFDIAILVAYGKIIPKDILVIPKYGFVNVHPSLLPKYRGPSPIQSAILAGEEKTGVTIMLLDEKVDHGPVLAQKEIEIEKADTHASLIEKLGVVGANLLLEVLPRYLEGATKPKPQDHSKATFTKHISKDDGYIDLNNPPNSKTLDRMIRAFYPWPGVWSEVKVESRKSKVESLMIKFLPANQLPATDNQQPFLIQPEGKRPMTIKEFLNGHHQTRELIEKLVSTNR